MLVHNYCSPPSHPLFYPFLTFLDLVFLHKIFVKTYNWSALGVFVAFYVEGDGDMCSQSHLWKKKNWSLFLPHLFKSTWLPHPLFFGAPGSLKALIYISLFNVSFLRGYYANVPYISKSNTVFNLLHLFAWCLSFHPITDKDIDKWLNTCSYWVIIGLWKH